MDQGIVSTTTSRFVRLALIFLASVFGLLLLSFAFGSSSASADDGGPDDGGLVPAVADLAGDVVEHVAPVASAATEVIPLADVPLPALDSPAAGAVATVTEVLPTVGTVLDTTSMGPVVGAVAKTLDRTLDATVGAVLESVGPVLNGLTGWVPAIARIPVEAAAASIVSASLAAVTAAGTLPLRLPVDPAPFGSDAVASGASLSTSALPVAALGIGFFVLLFSRRLWLAISAPPVSPVYETDTSPD
ncbi:MAG: hypothetical protein ABIQ01_11095 [Pseudolysinimonas sp.]